MCKKVTELGHKVPYNSYRKHNNCCKDVNKYNYFILFNYGSVCLSPASYMEIEEEQGTEA
jgi:hypothetical protein